MSERRYSIALATTPEPEMDLFLEEFLPPGWGVRYDPYGSNVLELITDKGQVIGAAASTWIVYDHRKQTLSVRDQSFISGISGSLKPFHITRNRFIFYV